MSLEPDLADTGPPIRAQSKLVEKPAWAAFIWTDADSIWIELPCPVGKAPVVVQYSRAEGGLGKALSLIEQCANIRKEAPPPGWFKHVETTRVVNATAAKLAKPSLKDKKGPLPNLHEQPKQLQDSIAALLKKKGWV